VAILIWCNVLLPHLPHAHPHSCTLSCTIPARRGIKPFPTPWSYRYGDRDRSPVIIRRHEKHIGDRATVQKVVRPIFRPNAQRTLRCSDNAQDLYDKAIENDRSVHRHTNKINIISSNTLKITRRIRCDEDLYHVR
jgi:hypothetical protein